MTDGIKFMAGLLTAYGRLPCANLVFQAIELPIIRGVIRQMCGKVVGTRAGYLAKKQLLHNDHKMPRSSSVTQIFESRLPMLRFCGVSYLGKQPRVLHVLVWSIR